MNNQEHDLMYSENRAEKYALTCNASRRLEIEISKIR